MPSPYDSSTSTKFNFSSGDPRIDALVISGTGNKWGGPVGTGATITYSFPGPGSVWANPYLSITRDLHEPERNIGYFDATEQAAARRALQAWETVANITFVEVPDTPNSVGDIRFARTDSTADNLTAHSSNPNPVPRSGDVWFRNDAYPGGDGLNSARGFWVLLHEIGHSIGLDHPFAYAIRLPTGESTHEYTVMAYFTSPSIPFPAAPMPYDIAAITYLYGPKGSLNPPIVENLGYYDFDGSNAADTLVGHAGLDNIRGYAGNDAMTGAMGNDFLDGGAGVDTALYSGPRASYAVTKSSVSGPEGNDRLSNVERVQFSDRKIAFDLGTGEAAGNTVKILGAAFGSGAIQNRAYVGIGLNLFDSGLSMAQVCEGVVQAMGALSNQNFVTTAYQNVIGSAPTTALRDAFVALLQGSGGNMSQADLLMLAANADANLTHINLVGLQQSGVEFS